MWIAQVLSLPPPKLTRHQLAAKLPMQELIIAYRLGGIAARSKHAWLAKHMLDIAECPVTTAAGWGTWLQQMPQRPGGLCPSSDRAPRARIS